MSEDEYSSREEDEGPMEFVVNEHLLVPNMEVAITSLKEVTDEQDPGEETIQSTLKKVGALLSFSEEDMSVVYKAMGELKK